MNVLQFWLIDSIVKAQKFTTSGDESQIVTDSEPLVISQEEDEESEMSIHTNNSARKSIEVSYENVSTEDDSRDSNSIYREHNGDIRNVRVFLTKYLIGYIKNFNFIFKA